MAVVPVMMVAAVFIVFRGGVDGVGDGGSGGDVGDGFGGWVVVVDVALGFYSRGSRMLIFTAPSQSSPCHSCPPAAIFTRVLAQVLLRVRAVHDAHGQSALRGQQPVRNIPQHVPRSARAGEGGCQLVG